MQHKYLVCSQLAQRRDIGKMKDTGFVDKSECRRIIDFCLGLGARFFHSIVVYDGSDVIASLFYLGHPPEALHQVLPGVVGCETQAQIVVKSVHKGSEMLHPSSNVLFGIKTINNSQASRSSWH